jgi:hypothetical protein
MKDTVKEKKGFFRMIMWKILISGNVMILIVILSFIVQYSKNVDTKVPLKYIIQFGFLARSFLLINIFQTKITDAQKKSVSMDTIDTNKATQ